MNSSEGQLRFDTVWTCTEEGQRSGLKIELPGRSKKGRFTDICNEGGHAESWCDRGGLHSGS